MLNLKGLPSASSNELIARLVSPRYLGSNDQSLCFEFWYHFYGEHDERKLVLSMSPLSDSSENDEKTTNDGKQVPLWSRNSSFVNIDNRWRQAHVTFASSKDFQLIFEGIQRLKLKKLSFLCLFSIN